MSSIEEHCRDCIDELGYPYREVHEWLDAFAVRGDMFCGNHHKYRHHREGLEQIEKMWGEDAKKAAVIHIQQDMLNETASIRIMTQEEITEWSGPDRWYKRSEVFGDE